MTSENQGADPYEAVLADLRAQRDKIDQTIELLTTLRGGTATTPSTQNGTVPDSGIVETAGMFLGMSIVDASKKLLAMRKRTMGNVEIAREIQAGGLVLTGKDPVNVVGSVLTRRFNEIGDVVKVGRGIWGLKEWYPGRNFKTANKASAMIEEVATQATRESAVVSNVLPDIDGVFGALKDEPKEGTSG